MKTAVMIELDYTMNSEARCHQAWQALEEAFLDNGFSIQERMFTIEIGHFDATLRAEAAIRQAALHLKLEGMSLGNVLRNCSAFEIARFTPLEHPHPEATGIDVDFIDPETFRRLVSLRATA